MGFQILLLLLCLCLNHKILAGKPVDANIAVRGVNSIAQTDDNFVCATLDWWPPEKCNYHDCPWGNASVLNLNLYHPFLTKAIQAFDPLRIRIGGSLQDQVMYDVGNLGSPCVPFEKMAGGLFGFSNGCLSMDRWDELNLLFKKTGALVTFGLNALHGRRKVGKSDWRGPWNSSNARSFIEYTISKGHQIDSWEFGNELCGRGVEARVTAEQYGKDIIRLKAILDELYKTSNSQPLLLAPGGFFDRGWFAKLLQVSGSDVVNVVTHHIYNLGPAGYTMGDSLPPSLVKAAGFDPKYLIQCQETLPAELAGTFTGNDPSLINNILDPHHLDNTAGTFRDIRRTIQTQGQWATAWVGESGGAYNSGGRSVSDTFVNSFWYLDQLGMASKFGTKAYCRQSLVGGNYGLLDKTTFVPNPDYYSALLWHHLMGKRVLAVDFKGSPFLRSYAHCSKGKAGVTLLLINLSRSTKFRVSVGNSMNIELPITETIGDSSFIHVLKKTVAWVGRKALERGGAQREEYHLTPKDGNLQSRTMVLNGTPLELSEDGNIPVLDPLLVDVHSPIYIAPLSIAFVAFPDFEAPACR